MSKSLCHFTLAVQGTSQAYHEVEGSIQEIKMNKLVST